MDDITRKIKNGPFGRFYFLLILLLFSIAGFSQSAGISPTGATPPNSSAGLDVNFTNQGLLIARVALTSTSSFAPLAAHVAGMLVYNTATAADVVPGFYVDNGTKWIPGLPVGNLAGEMQYWNGTAWVSAGAGTAGQLLQISSLGVPSWVSTGVPVLSTAAATGITSTTAVSGGTVTSDGGFPVTALGVCWGLASGPTIAGSNTVNGTGIGTFVSNITGLVSGQTYHVRAYATNSAGTAYGNEITVISP